MNAYSTEYERIVSDAHIGIAGFGGAFLAMVGMTFFFDNDKEVHWIAAIEKAINKFSNVPAVEIGLVLVLVYWVSTLLVPADKITFLTAAVLGLVTFIAVHAIAAIIEEREAAKKAAGGKVVLTFKAKCHTSIGERVVIVGTVCSDKIS